MDELKVLELYSGIGGMHYALKGSYFQLKEDRVSILSTKINAKIVGAVDINPHANIVYKHNFKETPNIQKTIEVIK